MRRDRPIEDPVSVSLLARSSSEAGEGETTPLRLSEKLRSGDSGVVRLVGLSSRTAAG
jgi:hypothetical protein